MTCHLQGRIGSGLRAGSPELNKPLRTREQAERDIAERTYQDRPAEMSCYEPPDPELRPFWAWLARLWRRT